MKKLMNKKAFTLMEMLIVVAIIAVLVAIAIPTMSSALTKAKEAKDVANVRAAYAEVVVDELTGEEALPLNQAAFLAKVHDGVEAGKLTYVTDPASPTTADDIKTATITYTGDKLTGGNGTTTSEYVWTITPVE